VRLVASRMPETAIDALVMTTIEKKERAEIFSRDNRGDAKASPQLPR
jgi:hypothetical protein